MGVPDTAFLLEAAHRNIVDRADLVTLGAGGLTAVVVGLRSAALEAERCAVVLEQETHCTVGSFQQLLAVIGSQGELALEAVWCQIPGVPGRRAFGVKHIILDSVVVSHSDFSFKPKNPDADGRVDGMQAHGPALFSCLAPMDYSFVMQSPPCRD